MKGNGVRILCLHQGAELYGSDRSFLSTIDAIAESAEVNVVLPERGSLGDEIEKIEGVTIQFFPKGILRKNELKHPLRFIKDVVSAIYYYFKLFSQYQIVYINTTVMLSALVAAFFYRFSDKKCLCHVREIPDRRQLIFFQALLFFSGVELVYNSKATRDAFKLSGRVIYNGVEQPEFVDISHAASALVGDKVNLLLIGRINSWKGQDFLVQALSDLPTEKLNRLSIRIVGSAFLGNEYLEEELVSQINLLGLTDVVTLLPFCEEPLEHYLWAHFVLVPSTKPEPFGRVAVEAFAAEKPVIASKHGGLTEIVKDNYTGFLFTPNDRAEFRNVVFKIINLDESYYSELCKNAFHDFQTRFSIQSYKREIKSLFSQASE